MGLSASNVALAAGTVGIAGSVAALGYGIHHATQVDPETGQNYDWAGVPALACLGMAASGLAWHGGGFVSSIAFAPVAAGSIGLAGIGTAKGLELMLRELEKTGRYDNFDDPPGTETSVDAPPSDFTDDDFPFGRVAIGVAGGFVLGAMMGGNTFRPGMAVLGAIGGATGSYLSTVI